ncbi:carboxynorspermidine decarboxylase [Methylomonas methanica]|uniref:Carboxynorspermidine/carboxyspermidine decarboxylase n=1 Tax=Methylomonas methanica (strain DSM 25384 / MC09) TaxID=857087 RepID=F9ZXI7_METMM|nr:carboxynorspermidine decarboxylase [Methylomonas methanica]AEG00975.1 Orn/DAP/Arg decarboxylase 2 [Methylomonas methanica MC09]
MITAEELKRRVEHSPAFILDMPQVHANLQPLQRIRQASDCRVLYSMKALPLGPLLADLKKRVDGVSVSSLFEARLAHAVLGGQGSLHLTSPGLRSEEFAELGRLCTHISFNSLSQYQRLHASGDGYSKGLRVNPKLSFADDERYDPCRAHSKLGVDVALLQTALPAGIEGLHIHTVFGQTDFQPLQAVIAKLKPFLLRQSGLKWLNLGGGYLYHSISDLNPIIDTIRYLKAHVAEQVFLEPGKALVGNAGYLLTTVLDRFESDGKTVLVLDSSVNHHPEIFEYQRQPLLLDEHKRGCRTAILAGSTCLAGDIFGEYRFDTLPAAGDKMIFADVGAYSLIKAQRFNGYALPTLYLYRDDAVTLLKEDEYADYSRQWLG